MGSEGNINRWWYVKVGEKEGLNPLFQEADRPPQTVINLLKPSSPQPPTCTYTTTGDDDDIHLCNELRNPKWRNPIKIVANIPRHQEMKIKVLLQDKESGWRTLVKWSTEEPTEQYAGIFCSLTPPHLRMGQERNKDPDRWIPMVRFVNQIYSFLSRQPLIHHFHLPSAHHWWVFNVFTCGWGYEEGRKDSLPNGTHNNKIHNNSRRGERIQDARMRTNIEGKNIAELTPKTMVMMVIRSHEEL